MRKGYLTAIVITILSLSLCGWVFHALRLADHLSASVLDLIPQEDHDPQVQMARALVQSQQTRIVLLSLESPGGQALSQAARETFLHTLEASGDFDAVFDLGSQTLWGKAGELFLQLRNPLLFPAHLERLTRAQAKNAATTANITSTTNVTQTSTAAATATPAQLTTEPQTGAEMLARETVKNLDDFLGTAAALAYQPLIPRDPMLLVYATFEHWRKTNADSMPSAQPERMLVWAMLRTDEPLQRLWPEAEKQLQRARIAAATAQREFLGATGSSPTAATALEATAVASAAAVAEKETASATTAASTPATMAATASTPATLNAAEILSLRVAAVGPFFSANEQAIRKEVAFFNIASISAVLLLCALLLRSTSVLFHTVAVLSISLPVAWIITLLIFPRVPILGLVIGSVLVSVAIDYCLHVFLAGTKSEGEEGPLLRPLLLSCTTTTLAFLALTLSPLPLLRQTGVFVAIGLVLTCALALLYKKLLGGLIVARTRPAITITRALPWKIPAALVAVVLAGGLSRIDWGDSIADLQYPLPALQQEDEAVRALFGASGKSVFISSGETFAQARDALAAFEASLPQGIALTSLSQWIPTREQYENAIAFVSQTPEFAENLRNALDEDGYETQLFAPFFEEWENFYGQSVSSRLKIPAASTADTATTTSTAAGNYEALIHRLRDGLPGPLGSLIGVEGGQHLLISTASVPAQFEPQTQGTVKADTSGSLSEVFARYRHNALRLSLGGIFAVIVGGLIAYGPRRGTQVLLVPLSAGLCALGTLGYLHGSLNLFHVIGMFLGVCLALDYGAFALRSSRGVCVPYSVCIAAATTLASFLLLTLSRIPAINALGLTVALCIIYAFSIVVLLTIPRRKTTRQP